MPETSNALIDQLVYIDNFINNTAEDTPNLDVDSQLSLDLAAFADDSFVFPDEDKPKNEDEDPHDEFHQEPSNSASLGNNDSWFGSFNKKGSKDKDAKGLSVNERTKLAKMNRLNHYQQRHVDALNTPTLPSQAHNNENGIHYNETGISAASFAPSEPSNESNNIFKDPQPDLSNLPKFPVPSGAKNSLQQAGLSQYQIELLSALIAQHQGTLDQQHADPYHNQDQNSKQDQSRSNRDPNYANVFAIAPTLAYHSADTPGSVGSAFSSGSSSHASSALATPSISSASDFAAGEGRNSVSGEGRPVDRSSELDKRKRNTAASARFRIKKKMKEKELEAKIQHLDELIRQFEIKVGELQMENRLLKNLIIEKGNRNSDEELLLLKERVKSEKRD
ncbi:hypothetical protein FDK38_004006 [Candidozyma auris]|nr:hypothetical protein FDK38_004006 [[Candida] auris]